MKPKAFIDYELLLQEYCNQQNLNFYALMGLSKGQSNDFIVFYCPLEGDAGKRGLLDETPCKVALRIRKTADGIVFEQTEHTAKYLKNQHNA